MDKKNILKFLQNIIQSSKCDFCKNRAVMYLKNDCMGRNDYVCCELTSMPKDKFKDIGEIYKVELQKEWNKEGKCPHYEYFPITQDEILATPRLKFTVWYKRLFVKKKRNHPSTDIK